MPGEIFRELGLFMGLASVVLLSPLILLGLAIPNAILHQRNAREVERDPQLGLKAALYFFYSVSILLFLTGLSIIIVDLMRDAELLGVNAGFRRGAPGTFTGEKRTGAALMFAGFTFGLAHFIVIQMATNDRRWPRT